MKKILSLTLALAMLGTALTGCGSKTAAPETSVEPTQQTAPYQQEQSQTEKALALINTFATGDTDTARSLLSDGYIQHNLAYGTGADAFIGSVEYLASADVKTTVNNIRAFVTRYSCRQFIILLVPVSRSPLTSSASMRTARLPSIGM